MGRPYLMPVAVSWLTTLPVEIHASSPAEICPASASSH